MDSPPPAPWTYAARAAFFGDLVCPFCDHHNPAGAKFCNECCSPLHLKPCSQCDAVNHQAATRCYKCGAEYAAPFTTHDAVPVLPPRDVATPAGAMPVDGGLASTAAGTLRASWRLAGIATILIAGVYAINRIGVATPDAAGVASQPIATGEHNAPAALSAATMAAESKPAEHETTAVVQSLTAHTDLEAPMHASTPERPVPVPAPKRTSTRQRPVPDVPVRTAASPPPAQNRVAQPLAQSGKPRQPDPWEAMQVSLASCSGDLIARILCDQRVRRQFCEGHWGEAPECASIANDHGQ